MSTNHYGPAAFGLPKLSNLAAASISEAFPVTDQSGILVYAEFHAALAPTTEVPTTLVATDADEVGNQAVIRPWLRTKAKASEDYPETQEAWMPLAPVTLAAIAHTANQPPPVIADAARCVATMIAIPNAIEAKLELISISAGRVTVWAAPVERAPA